MDPELIERRVAELLRSPLGCAMMHIMAEENVAPSQIVRPVSAMKIVADAYSALIPWNGDHDFVEEFVLRKGKGYGDLAHALVTEPGIEWWWSPLDRKNQVWVELESHIPFPEEPSWRVPQRPPTRFERYSQYPDGWISTSTHMDGQTSFLAMVEGGGSDMNPNYLAARRLVRVSPDASIYEVVSAEDWHSLVVRHGVKSDPKDAFHSGIGLNRPWGPNDLLVPDWSSIAEEWDGVHITLWAVLTATQVRIESDAGATETFLWEGEQTIWTQWVFDEVLEVEPYDFREIGQRIPYGPWPVDAGLGRFARFPGGQGPTGWWPDLDAI